MGVFSRLIHRHGVIQSFLDSISLERASLSAIYSTQRMDYFVSWLERNGNFKFAICLSFHRNVDHYMFFCSMYHRCESLEQLHLNHVRDDRRLTPKHHISIFREGKRQVKPSTNASTFSPSVDRTTRRDLWLPKPIIGKLFPWLPIGTKYSSLRGTPSFCACHAFIYTQTWALVLSIFRTNFLSWSCCLRPLFCLRAMPIS